MMIAKFPNKGFFIEEIFPAKDVSEEFAREESIRHSHISALHIW